jgi:predicted nucleic acid-binding protein
MARGTAPKEEGEEGRVSRVTGITLDTGALIALERRSQRMRAVYLRAIDLELQLTAPTVVIAEWWRGRTDARDKLFASLYVEPLTGQIAKAAGVAMAAVKRATLADAIVMASAALRGDLVYTSDFDDLDALRSHFPTVRILNV